MSLASRLLGKKSITTNIKCNESIPYKKVIITKEYYRNCEENHIENSEQEKDLTPEEKLKIDIDSLMLSLEQYINIHKFDDSNSETFKTCSRFNNLINSLSVHRKLLG